MIEPATKKPKLPPVAGMWARVGPGAWRRVRHPHHGGLPGRAVFEIAAHEGDSASARRPTCPLRSIVFHSAMCALNDPFYYTGYQLGALAEQDEAYHAQLVELYPVLGVVAPNYDFTEATGEFPRAHQYPRGTGGFGTRPWIEPHPNTPRRYLELDDLPPQSWYY